MEIGDIYICIYIYLYHLTSLLMHAIGRSKSVDWRASEASETLLVVVQWKTRYVYIYIYIGT